MVRARLPPREVCTVRSCSIGVASRVSPRGEALIRGNGRVCRYRCTVITGARESEQRSSAPAWACIRNGAGLGRNGSAFRRVHSASNYRRACNPGSSTDLVSSVHCSDGWHCAVGAGNVPREGPRLFAPGPSGVRHAGVMAPESWHHHVHTRQPREAIGLRAHAGRWWCQVQVQRLGTFGMGRSSMPLRMGGELR